MNSVYLGLARKERLPGIPSSILDNRDTFASGSPDMVPESNSLICLAVNSIRNEIVLCCRVSESAHKVKNYDQISLI